MKKILKLLLTTMLISVLVFSLAACGGKKTPKEDTYNQENQVEKDETSKTDEDKNTNEDKDTNDKKDETTSNEDEKDTSSESDVYPLTITDKYGKEITIEKEPKTVVSISPEFTETIFALGAGHKIIGRTDFCDYPSEVANIESIGSLEEFNIERVVDLNPDVVVTSAHVKDDAVAKLQEQGITVLSLSWNESFEGVYGYINTLGEVINKKEEANELVTSMKDKVAEIQTAIEGKEKPTTYFVVGYGEGGDFTATGDTFLSEAMALAGADNIAKDATGWAYSIEQIVDKDPQIIICSDKYDTKTTLESLEGYKDLTAVKEGRLYEIDENLFFRQGPRIVDGLTNLVKIIHPDAIK
ncbi:ABC transporter substrate-binding protein [Vallitalea maricola]|uniref:ABC transporter substrate-binding protein n=1 Tax=Vallitalea maricola TaxID=3074433 RepID=A0ACB5UQQ1_9FIRM|nr:ABC transporter substrate-binding protein [Vallitalea sp. AN17-2]